MDRQKEEDWKWGGDSERKRDIGGRDIKVQGREERERTAGRWVRKRKETDQSSERSKLSLFLYDKIVYIENPK